MEARIFHLAALILASWHRFLSSLSHPCWEQEMQVKEVRRHISIMKRTQVVTFLPLVRWRKLVHLAGVRPTILLYFYVVFYTLQVNQLYLPHK